MLTMIRDGHRQVGIYQQKVSQIGSRHYSRVARESIDPSSFLFSIAFHRRRGRFSLISQRIDTTFRSPVGFIASTWNVQFLQKELYSHENKRFKFQRINDKFSSILFHFDRLRDSKFLKSPKRRPSRFISRSNLLDSQTFALPRSQPLSSTFARISAKLAVSRRNDTVNDRRHGLQRLAMRSATGRRPHHPSV